MHMLSSWQTSKFKCTQVVKCTCENNTISGKKWLYTQTTHSPLGIHATCITNTLPYVHNIQLHNIAFTIFEVCVPSHSPPLPLVHSLVRTPHDKHACNVTALCHLYACMALPRKGTSREIQEYTTRAINGVLV